jgi:hypothetical protein
MQESIIEEEDKGRVCGPPVISPTLGRQMNYPTNYGQIGFLAGLLFFSGPKIPFSSKKGLA